MEEPDGFPPLSGPSSHQGRDQNKMVASWQEPGPSSQLLKRRIEREVSADAGRKMQIVSANVTEIEKIARENNELKKKLKELEDIIKSMKRTKSKERSKKREEERKTILEKELSAGGANESLNTFALLSNLTNQEPEPMEEGGNFITYLKNKNITGKKPINVSVGPSTKNNNSNLKKEKIPPINVFGQQGNEMVRLLAAEYKIQNFEVKRVTKQKLSILTKSLVDFNSAKKALSSVSVPHFTYTPKTEKPQTFLLKGLDCGENTADLLHMLKEAVPNVKFITVKNFSTRRSAMDGIMLPHYIVQITHDSSPADLQQLKFLNFRVVRWERLQKSEVNQCFRCQRFGHSAANCAMQPRCVKCNEQHATGECKLAKTEPKEKVYCVNCGVFGHPASYRGCPRYLDAKSRT